MYYFGRFLLIWLAIGFITGIKELFVEEIFVEEEIEELKEIAPLDTHFLIDLLFKNKRTFLAFYTLMGVLPLLASIYTKLKRT